MALETKIQSWLRAGLISEAQAEQIRKHEASTHNASWVTYGVAGIGVVILATGVISLIAANWEDIPPYVKLAAYAVTQGLLGLLVVKADKRGGVPREAALTFFALFILAGIGLVGQTYHLVSNGYGAIFFWLVLILPVTLHARSRLINHLWLAGFAAAIGIWAAARLGHRIRDLSPLLETVAIGFLVAGVGVWRGGGLSLWFRDAARNWSFLFVMFAVVSVASAGWYGPVDSSLRFGNSLALVWAASAVAAAVIASQHRYYGRALAVSLCLLFLLVAAYVTIPLSGGIQVNKIEGVIFFEMIWAVCASSAAFAGRRRIFDIATVVITLRAIVLYFEVFGSLAATGLGLVISGLLIVGAAWGWSRYHRELLAWLEVRA